MQICPITTNSSCVVACSHHESECGLANGLDGNPDGWYVSFLQSSILQHRIFFGYVIEWTKVIVGIVLITGALILLGQPRQRGEAQHGLMVGYSIITILAAIAGMIMVINFHFWLGGWVIPKFDPTSPYNEAIDLEGLLPLFSLIVIIAHVALVRALRGEGLLTRSTGSSMKAYAWNKTHYAGIKRQHQ